MKCKISVYFEFAYLKYTWLQLNKTFCKIWVAKEGIEGLKGIKVIKKNTCSCTGSLVVMFNTYASSSFNKLLEHLIIIKNIMITYQFYFSEKSQNDCFYTSLEAIQKLRDSFLALFCPPLVTYILFLIIDF